MNIMETLLKLPEWQEIDPEWIALELTCLQNKKYKLLKRPQLSEADYVRLYELDLEMEHWNEMLELFYDST